MSFEFNPQEFLILDLRLRGEREGGLEHHKLKEENKKERFCRGCMSNFHTMTGYLKMFSNSKHFLDT